MKTAIEIRAEFLDFFRDRKHQIVPSSPVIPQDDPTLLFINAGMNQFKDVFLGTGKRSYTRAADTQKCIRVSGKHNDLEEVGRDTYHHTFFEMLGNWSFGDYFKKDAIQWAWQLLTDVWKIPPEAMWVTVFGGDDKDNLPADEEAEQLWSSETNIPRERILRFGKKDNFWEMGDTGPCGPCSEIHIDMDVFYGREKYSPERKKLVNADSPAVIEIWNLVFIQFNRQEGGKLVTLPAKHVDTGMGLERLVTLLQGKNSNYDTDLFTPIIEGIADITGKSYLNSDELPDIAFRVIADHIRTLSIAFADGVLPGNSGRGYVLRRLLRRAARFAHQGLEMSEPFMHRLAPIVSKMYQGVFPEIGKRQEHISLLIKTEEERFGKTLTRGIELFGKLAFEVKEKKESIIPGDKAYQLYHQDGFPRDLVDLMAEEQNLKVDDAGWKKAEKQHVENSTGDKAAYDVSPAELEGLPATEFTGGFKFECNARILKLIDNDKLVLDSTPFYAESGGQIGDTGLICSRNFRFLVRDTQKYGDIFVHFGELEQGDLSALPERVTAYVDRDRRKNIMANHTATHLLHWALRKVLGEHANQQGSLVAPDRLRFDISHPNKIQEQELLAIENMVNERIYDNIPVRKTTDSFERAKKKGAIALFGEKYGEKVQVVAIGRYSKELCGGTHAYSTGDLGFFRIVSEGAVQAGVRRIEAITRNCAIISSQQERKTLDQIREQLKVHDFDAVIKRIQDLQDEVKQLKKQESKQMQQDHCQLRDDLLQKAMVINDIHIVVDEVGELPPGEMRILGDLLRKVSKKVVGLLVSQHKNKAIVIAFVGEKLMESPPIKAGELIKHATSIVGGGGDPRRVDFSQGQGPKLEKIPEMLESIKEMLQSKF